MRDETTQEEFDKWVKMWDQLSKQIADNHVADLTVKPEIKSAASNSEEPSWQDLYYRSQQVGSTSQGLIVDWTDKPATPTFGGYTPSKTNPTHMNSTGPDGVGPDGHVRVTPNFSDGDDLKELDEIKRKLEALERKHHEQEVREGKSSLKEELTKLRERIHKLSEKINLDPKFDAS